MTVVISILGFIVTSVLIPVLVGEFVDWLPWVATQVLRRAANHLPFDCRARYMEEWQAEFAVHSGGKLTRLLFAFRIYRLARSTRAALQEEEAATDTAARLLALAQQTADQAIADARREAAEMIGTARREADHLLAKARQEVERIAAYSIERDDPPGADDATG